MGADYTYSVGIDSRVGPQVPAAFGRLGALIDRFKIKAVQAFKSIGGPENFKQLKSAIGQVQTHMHVAGRKFAAAGALSAHLAVASGNVQQLNQATMGLISAPIQVGMAYQSAMSQVQAVTKDASGGSEEHRKNLELLAKQTRQLGSETSFSAREVALAQGFLGMSGMKTEKILGSMTGVLDLAKAGHVDLARAADVASNVMGAFKDKAGGMTNVAGVMVSTFTKSNTSVNMLADTFTYAAPIAAKVGMEIHELAALAGKLGDVGIQGSMAGTALRSALTRLAGPPKMAADSLRELGVATKEGGKLRKITAIIGDLNIAMKGMGDGDRMEHIKRIFGVESASAFAELLGQGQQKLEDFADEIKLDADGGSAARVAKQMGENLEGRMKNLNSAMEEFQLVVFDSLAPALTSLAEAGTAVVRVLGQWAVKNPTLVKIIFGFIAAIAGITAVIVPVLSIASLVASSWGMITVAFAAVKSAFLLAIPAVQMFGAALMTTPVGWILAAIVAIVATVAAVIYWRKEIVAAFVGAWEWIKNAWGTAPGWFKGLVALLLLPFWPFFLLINAIKTHWFGVYTYLQTNVFSPIANAAGGMMNFITGLFRGGSQAVMMLLSGLGTWVTETFASMGSSAAGKLFGTMIVGIQKRAGELWEVIKVALENVRTLLPFSDAKAGPLSDLTYSGGAFVSTFAGGVQKRTPELVQTVQGAAARASNALVPAAPSAPVRPAPLIQKDISERRETQNVVVDFRNVPRGAAVKQEGEREVDMSLGYAMETG